MGRGLDQNEDEVGKSGRFVAGFPLDIAAEAGLLRSGDRPAGQQRLQGTPKVASIHQFPIAGAAGVELAGVGQPSLGIDDKEIRRAGGVPSFGHPLGFVDQIGEIPPAGLGEGRHASRGIIGILAKVVGIDGHKRDPLGLKLLGDPAQAIADMDHIGTVIADENNNRGLLAGNLRQTKHLPRRVRQGEIGSLLSQWQALGRRSSGHGPI